MLLGTWRERQRTSKPSRTPQTRQQLRTMTNIMPRNTWNITHKRKYSLSGANERLGQRVRGKRVTKRGPLCLVQTALHSRQNKHSTFELFCLPECAWRGPKIENTRRQLSKQQPSTAHYTQQRLQHLGCSTLKGKRIIKIAHQRSRYIRLKLRQYLFFS